MSTYTKNEYIVSFDSKSPSDNLKKIVASLVGNVSQLSILEEHDETSSTYYRASIRYSENSNFVLNFGVNVADVEDGTKMRQLKMTIGAEDIGSPGTYSGAYKFNYYTANDSDNYNKVTTVRFPEVLNLENTAHGLKYRVLTFDNAVYLLFYGIRMDSGAIFNDLGEILISPLIDQFTSEKFGGFLMRRPGIYFGNNSLTNIYLGIHTGKATRVYGSSPYVTVGGTSYYAGVNSVASPMVFKSGDYSLIPFYGFVKDSEFLYQIRTGSNTSALDLSIGAKVEIGGHTFVYIGLGTSLFARIS